MIHQTRSRSRLVRGGRQGSGHSPLPWNPTTDAGCGTPPSHARRAPFPDILGLVARVLAIPRRASGMHGTAV
jgi:hypothetical protein